MIIKGYLVIFKYPMITFLLYASQAFLVQCGGVVIIN